MKFVRTIPGYNHLLIISSLFSDFMHVFDEKSVILQKNKSCDSWKVKT